MARSKEWMTSGKVADLFGVDRSTIYRLSKEKLAYRFSPGGQRLYRRSDVYAYGRDSMGLDLPDEEPNDTQADS